MKIHPAVDKERSPLAVRQHISAQFEQRATREFIPSISLAWMEASLMKGTTPSQQKHLEETGQAISVLSQTAHPGLQESMPRARALSTVNRALALGQRDIERGHPLTPYAQAFTTTVETLDTVVPKQPGRAKATPAASLDISHPA